MLLTRSILFASFAIVLSSAASAQFNGLTTGLRTYVAGAGSDGQDTNQVQSDTSNPTLLGHSEASFKSDNATATAVADAHATYGDLSANLHTVVTHLPAEVAYSVSTFYGGPASSFYDRVYVQGGNAGQVVTLHVTGQLTGLTLVYGNNNDQLNTPQGFSGGINVSPVGGGVSSLGVAKMRQGSVYTDVVSASFDRDVVVGSYFDLNASLYADAQVYDSFFPNEGTFEGTSIGHFLTSLQVTAPGIGLVGTSGHVYQAVPEPMSIAGMGLALLALSRKRRRA